MIYRSPQFNKIVTEYFDLSDKETFSYLRSIEEADQNKVMIALTSKLYDHLVEKVDDIDFGDIPKSRGDITKLPNYEKVVDCISIIRGILENARQDLEPVITLEDAVKNLNEYKEIFVKGYQLNMELPMVVYNTMVLSIYSGISIMISSCIEFVKATDDTGFDIALDRVQLKKTKDALIFRDLKALNSSFEHGTLPKALEQMLRQNTKNLVGTSTIVSIATIGAVMGVILNIIPILRELAFYFYYSRTKVADYFDAQSALLQMNAYNLASKAADDSKDVEEIKKKQLKIADKFKKISNAIAIKNNKAEVSAEKETKDLEKKLKITDVKDVEDDSSESLW